MKFDSLVKHIKRQLRTKGFVLLNNIEMDNKFLLNIAKKLGKPVEQEYGLVIEMQNVNYSTEDLKLKNKYIPWHNEGVYLEKPYKYLMLGCLKPASVNGKTLLLEGEKAASYLLKKYPFLKNVKIEHKRKDKKAIWPVIVNYKKKKVLFYRQEKYSKSMAHNLVLNSSNIDSSKIIKIIEDFIANVKPDFSHNLQKGELLIFDNFRFLTLGKSLVEID